MMISLAKLVTVASLAMLASAKTIRVNVGKTGLAFDPNNFNASANDVLEFHFYAKNHSVVMGDFDNACVPAPSGGFFSGWFPTNGTGQNSNVFSVTINDTTPIVFYCSQNTGSHCKNGMAGVVNPTLASSLDNYLALAKNAQEALSPVSVFGGTTGPAPAETTTSSGTTGTSSSPTDTSSPTTSTKPNGAGALGASFGGLAAAAAAAVLVLA